MNAAWIRRWAGWVALAIVLVGALTIGSAQGTPTAADREQALAESIRCPQCAGQSVASSETQSANAVRQLIRDGIRNGDTDQDIRSYIASRYGREILLDPSSKGLGVLVWGVPVAAAIIAVGVLTLKFSGWRAAPVAPLSDEDRRRVDEAREQQARGPDDRGDDGEGDDGGRGPGPPGRP